MATKKQISASTDVASLKSVVDTAYTTTQHGIFTGGIAAQIGVHAFAIWSAIKTHADFETGECWPGIRHLAELTGMSSQGAQNAIKVLEEFRLVRVRRLGKRNIYVARERLDVRIGGRIICTIILDYVPLSMREKIMKLKASALAGDFKEEAVWSDVELIPGEGMVYDPAKGLFNARMRADEVTEPTVTVTALRDKLRQTADEMRKQLEK